MLPTASGEPGAPTVLGDRYEILSPLGSGSMASVFRVRDRRDESLRAAKVLTPENAAKPEILARFEDEFRILRTLHHPHLPEVTDYGWTKDGGRYLIMELVEGEPLDQYFRARPDDIWVILYQLCEALTFVHSKNLLHQDIKPSNILVTRTRAYGPEMPLVKLIDFGLTYRRDTGAAVQLVGTPAYVAPEVVQGEAPLTRAVDYYSLGATLFELLCGAPPFVGTVAEVLRAQVEREPVIEDERLEWAELYPHVRALLTKDRKARLEAFEEFRRAIVSRLTGGIDELDKAYGLARIESLPMIGKDEVWKELMGWLEGMARGDAPALMVLGGESGCGKSYLVNRVRAEAAARGLSTLRLGHVSDVPWLVKQNGLGSASEALRIGEIWNRLRAQTSESQVVLVIDGPEHLTPFETNFVHAVGALWLLTEERIRRRLGFLLVGKGATALRDLELALPVESRVAAAIPSMSSSALANSIGDFRASMDSRDLRTLTACLQGATTSGAMIAMLVAASARGLLIYGAQRWRVAPTLSSFLLEPKTRRWSPHALDDFLRGEIRTIRHHRACMNYSEVEYRCRSALVQFVAADPNGHHRPRLLEYFLKRQIEALWARNRYVHLYHATSDWQKLTRRRVPSNAVPRYVRGMMDTRGPKEALTYLTIEEKRFTRDPLRARLSLEKALCAYNVGHYEAAMSSLDRVDGGNGLTAGDRCRSMLYRVMCMHAIGRTEIAARLLTRASECARENECHDEYLLGEVLRALFVMNRGAPARSLSIIARAVPIAHREQLLLRHFHLLMMASSSYEEEGEYGRAARCRERMIRLASTMGNTDLVAGSWTKLAQYSRNRGYFGNAMRYVNRARSVLERSATAQDRSRLCYAEMALHIALMSDEVGSVVSRASSVMRGVRHTAERGHYKLLLGDYFVKCSNPSAARRCYKSARALFERVVQNDDAVRAAVGECNVALEAGKREDVARLREYIDKKGRALKGVDIRANVRLLHLLDCVVARNTPDLHRCMRETKDLDIGVGFATQLSICRARFAVYARRGDVLAAIVEADKYFDLVRRALSNLSGEELPRAFLAAVGFEEMAREVALLRRAGNHAAQGVIAGRAATSRSEGRQS